MRKRIRRESKEEQSQASKVSIEQPKEKRKDRKKIFYAITLIGIFFLVLFFNSYFNYTSNIAFNPQGTTLGTRFYLSGPDPYYNMRQCTETLRLGYYPYVPPHSYDPMLNYPTGLRGTRPPLFTMMTVGSTQILQNFMPQMDALGWCMLFLPAIYGALMIFPIYGIGTELFNRRVGLIAAFLVAIIPVHINSGHGSAFSLFDDDSWVQLLFVLTFYFVIKAIKEKDFVKSTMYASLGGLFVGATYLSWTASQLLSMILLVYFVFQVGFNIFKSKHDIKFPAKFFVLFLVAFLVSLPYILMRQDFTGFPTIVLIASAVILAACYVLEKLKTPWIISLPIAFTGGGIFFAFLYLISQGIINIHGSIRTLAITIFGEGIYGSKISQTVAEAHTIGISNTAMSIGPVLYWLGFAGFGLFCILTWKQKWRPENFFFIILFVIDLILIGQAGRFINDQIPTMAVFAAFIILIIVDKINLKKMIKDIKAVGGFRGIRKGIHIIQILGIAFIVFGLLIPNIFLTMDAAVPPPLKEKVFGKGYQGVFGTSLYQEYYWSDADYWLSQQDKNIPNDANKPAFISWWDYGFYEVAQGKHPAVAENYQDGIPPASHLHTAESEQEAVCVLIIRIAEGSKHSDNTKALLPEPIKEVFGQYLNETNSTKIINYLEDPAKYCPSYNQLIDPQYGNTVMRVQDVNAMYQDSINLLMNNLNDEQLTNLYIDMQKATGYSIRYYGVETYDTQIFSIFPFLSDKSTFEMNINGVVPEEDRYMKVIYTDTVTGSTYNRTQLDNTPKAVLDKMQIQSSVIYKDEYFATMFYRVYYGPYDGSGQAATNRYPTYLLKHFIAEYISPYVIVAKYYADARVTGTVKVNGSAYANAVVVLRDQYGIPHDLSTVDTNGNFSVLASAGNLTLGIIVNNKEIDNVNLTVTEDQADRIEPFDQDIAINIKPASFNCSIKGNQTGLMLTIYDELNYNTQTALTTSLNQTLTFNNLIPANYALTFTNSTGAVVYNTTAFLQSGANSLNVTIPS